MTALKRLLFSPSHFVQMWLLFDTFHDSTPIWIVSLVTCLSNEGVLYVSTYYNKVRIVSSICLSSSWPIRAQAASCVGRPCIMISSSSSCIRKISFTTTGVFGPAIYATLNVHPFGLITLFCVSRFLVSQQTIRKKQLPFQWSDKCRCPEAICEHIRAPIHMPIAPIKCYPAQQSVPLHICPRHIAR